ncbi:hypothetical protein P8452_05572 [Trifolium repens]|nr:hypothetical protein P8452_05566 [Trifolium repens]WJX15429.1 hypothetical protein P8452_05572 [Trifolium repens]
MASSSSSSTTKVSLKLLIDTKNEKVLFAEASKSAIDFLFNLLSLPIGTVVKLLSSNGMVGSLGNLYQSVENLDQKYMLPNPTKDVLLNPRAQSFSTEISGFLTQNDDNDVEETKLYMCPNKCNFEVTNDNTTRCTALSVVASSSAFEYTPTPSPEYNSSKTMSHKVHYQMNRKRIVGNRTIIRNGIVNEGPEYGVCEKYMSSEVSYIGNGASNIKNGFVKDDVTFLVMDDLLIQPMSTVSSTITLLDNLNIKEIGTFQEKVVEMGMNEGIKLLKASLQSKMVLTSVFIKERKSDM